MMTYKRLYPSLSVSCGFCLALSGCASNYNPDDWYDSKAGEKPGRIIEKKISKIEERGRADSPPGTLIPIPAGGAIYFLPINTSSSRGLAQIPIYEYVVRVNNTEIVSVISEYPSHAVGECVKVLFSSRPSYPRIAQSTCP
jgi:hypothetical protein